MIVKIILCLLLIVFVGIQCFFIYWLGGYNPSRLNELLRLWESFGTKIIPYTAFILSISKFKIIWLIPKLNLIFGLWLIIKKDWHIGLLAVLFSFVIAMALVGAVYNPQMIAELG